MPIWRPRRKILLPAFSPKIVDSFVPVFVEQGRKLAEKLQSRAGEEKFSAWPFISSYTLDSVCGKLVKIVVHLFRIIVHNNQKYLKPNNL